MPDTSPTPINSAVAESLEQRLSIGYQRIEDAKAAGIDATALEDFWIKLLHQYEAAMADFADAA